MKLLRRPSDFADAKEASRFATRIVKEASNVRVIPGKTNGRITLHVFVPGASSLGRTIYSQGEWENHPANVRRTRSKNEERDANG